MDKKEYIEKLVFREIKGFNISSMVKALNARQISTEVSDGLRVYGIGPCMNSTIGSLMYNPSTDTLYKLTLDYSITVHSSWILPQTIDKELLTFVEYTQTLHHERSFIEMVVNRMLNEDVPFDNKLESITKLEIGGLIIVKRNDQGDTRNRPTYTSVKCTFY